MKRAIYTFFIIAWISYGGTFSHTVSASNNYRDITLTVAGTLLDSLHIDDTPIDSLVVSGPINDFDFSTLRTVAALNENFVINLAYADVENKTIPESAFYEYTIHDHIRRIILPDDIHTIEDFAFQSLSNLTDINMPTGLRQLGEQAFFNCSGLAMDTLRIPEGIEVIPKLCFSGCTRLKHLVFPKSLKHIKNGAFDNAFRIQSLTFQEGLESIGFVAFRGMVEIDTIRLPQSVTMIDEAAFAHNFALKYINIPTGITTIPIEFVKGCDLKDIYIPANVVTIEEGAFSGNPCTRLRLSENLTTIQKGSFYYNALTDILLPASLRFIGSRVFASATVKKVYCPATIPPALESTDKGQWAFAGCGDDATLFVPIGCGETYRNTPGWNNFSNIVEIAQFPSDLEQVSENTSWTATGAKGMIHLQNNAETPVKLRVYALGGELMTSIQVENSTTIEITPGNYLINDGKRAKTVIVK